MRSLDFAPKALVLTAFLAAAGARAQAPAPNLVVSAGQASATSDRPIVLCRKRGCSEIGDRMSRSFLFNSLAQVFYANDKTKAYMCEADIYTRACKSNGFKYALNVGGTPAVVHVPSFTITEVSFAKNLRSITFMLNYDIYVNGLKTFCSTSRNTLGINDRKQAIIVDDNYRCQLTSDIPSTSYNIYNIDYIDLDYGIIGAYYSTGMSGSATGGSEGYILIKFQNAPNTTGMSAGLGASCGGPSCAEEDAIPAGQYEVLPYREAPGKPSETPRGGK